MNIMCFECVLNFIFEHFFDIIMQNKNKIIKYYIIIMYYN